MTHTLPDTRTVDRVHVDPSPLELETPDGLRLGATHWAARGASQGVVLIAPATGVPHRFYKHFASFLAGKGFDVLSWDWRGIAASRTRDAMGDPRMTMRNWGEIDLAAAIAWADARAAGNRVTLVGHSFGGQALGLAPNASRVDRAVFIAAQHGWVGHWPLRYGIPLAFLWWVMMPSVTRLVGHFPSWVVRFGEDLPKGVALEWARWCGRREHMGTWDGHARLTLPLLSISFDDDPIAPRRPAAALLERYANAAAQHEHWPATGLGHFGFFRPGQSPEGWEQVATFLQASTIGSRGP
jgi:predicted alpha/beta hydrolase